MLDSFHSVVDGMADGCVGVSVRRGFVSNASDEGMIAFIYVGSGRTMLVTHLCACRRDRLYLLSSELHGLDSILKGSEEAWTHQVTQEPHRGRSNSPAAHDLHEIRTSFQFLPGSFEHLWDAVASSA